MQLLWWALKTLNTAPMQPAVALLGMYSKGLKTGSQRVSINVHSGVIHNGSKEAMTQMSNR